MQAEKTPVVKDCKNSLFTKFIYPFGFDFLEKKRRPMSRRKKMWQKVIKSFAGSDDWRRLEQKNLEYILPHIEAFLDGSDSDNANAGKYVASFTLVNRTLQIKVPGQGYAKLVVKQQKNQTRSYPFRIKNVDIYLFRSGVGMLIFDTELLAKSPHSHNTDNADSQRDEITDGKRRITLNDLIDFNYNFRQSLREKEQIQQGSESIAARRFIEKSKGQNVNFTLRFLITELLQPIYQASGSIYEFYDERLLGYSFALLEKNENQDDVSAGNNDQYDDIKEYLFWLRNFFRKDYLPPTEETRVRDNPHVLATFENILFGMSMDGGAVLVRDSGNPFVRETFSSRVRKNYFLLFLLVLHQRLATIYFTMQLSDKALNYQFRSVPEKMLFNDLKLLRGQIFEFMIKCWFADVSNMEMYSRVYHRWQDVLQVKRLLQSVKSSVEELDDYFRRIQTERETRFMNMLSWLFFPLMIIFGFWGMNFTELTQPGFSLFNPKIWLVTGVGFGVYYLFVWLFKKVLK